MSLIKASNRYRKHQKAKHLEKCVYRLTFQQGLTSLTGRAEVAVLTEVCVFVFINAGACGGCEIRNLILLLITIF
jgi:hypothetical protein